MEARRSRLWNLVFRGTYATLRVLDPLVRWTWFSVGIGITSRLTVRGRRTGRDRQVLVGLIRVDGAWYVGHPNGEAAWTANLRAAGVARVALRPESPIEVQVVPLSPGPERTGVIVATADQQPFPGNVLYGAARRHILSEGQYFRLESRTSGGAEKAAPARTPGPHLPPEARGASRALRLAARPAGRPPWRSRAAAPR